MNTAATMKLEQTKQCVEAWNAVMSGSKFTDVNLKGAAFKDVNLAGATFHDANLSGLRISQAFSAGGWPMKQQTHTGERSHPRVSAPTTKTITY